MYIHTVRCIILYLPKHTLGRYLRFLGCLVPRFPCSLLWFSGSPVLRKCTQDYYNHYSHNCFSSSENNSHNEPEQETQREPQPDSKPDRSRFWTSGTLVWGAVRLIYNCN